MILERVRAWFTRPAATVTDTCVVCDGIGAFEHPLHPYRITLCPLCAGWGLVERAADR